MGTPVGDAKGVGSRMGQGGHPGGTCPGGRVRVRSGPVGRVRVRSGPQYDHVLMQVDMLPALMSLMHLYWDKASL